MKVGVLGAMQEEVSAVLAMLERPATTHVGSRDYTQGRLAGHEVITAHSRIGKVASASAAIELLSRFGVEQIIFLGLAGALLPELTVGDIIIAEGLMQHDMDASPLFPPLEVPLTGCSRFATTPGISHRLAEAAQAVLNEQSPALEGAERHSTQLDRPPRIVRGDVATGDQFIADVTARNRVLVRVPSAVCVEMEGAAVAQVCQEYRTPFGIVRMISDAADDSASSDFSAALGRTTTDLSAAIVRRYLASL